ncbi:hypothetical protein [Flavihumibacter fluvii]|uniref:hypothetical protein n=1 Tax=Flavihumibacter fluvii TaxID=2838157 RepID=UPI001BDE177E|nr:hypothetical protein [Flavihumibacter fluvii]ULQ53626.1 hypothetical protein KJS93_04735 [Flavihumibacter fluvii]
MKAYFIFDGSGIVLPATIKTPLPRWWMVRGFLTAGSIHAFTPSRRPYIFDNGNDLLLKIVTGI